MKAEFHFDRTGPEAQLTRISFTPETPEEVAAVHHVRLFGFSARLLTGRLPDHAVLVLQVAPPDFSPSSSEVAEAYQRAHKAIHEMCCLLERQADAIRRMEFLTHGDGADLEPQLAVERVEVEAVAHVLGSGGMPPSLGGQLLEEERQSSHDGLLG